MHRHIGAHKVRERGPEHQVRRTFDPAIKSGRHLEVQVQTGPSERLSGADTEAHLEVISGHESYEVGRRFVAARIQSVSAQHIRSLQEGHRR